MPAVDGDSDGCRGGSGDLYVDGVGAVDVTPDSDADVARTDVEQAALQVQRLQEGGSGRLTSPRSPRKAAFERVGVERKPEPAELERLDVPAEDVAAAEQQGAGYPARRAWPTTSKRSSQETKSSSQETKSSRLLPEVWKGRSRPKTRRSRRTRRRTRQTSSYLT